MDRIDDVAIECPYCGEVFSILADTGYGSQKMVEDCSVCCRPIDLVLTFSGGELVSVVAEAR